MKQRPPAFQFYPRQWMGDKAVLAMDWDAQGMHLWLMGIAWQSTPSCCIPNEEELIRMWLKNPDDGTWNRVWPQIKRGWKISGVFLKQSGLARELRKQQKFSRFQSLKAQKRWKRRRNSDHAGASIRHESGICMRASNALQSSSAEAEEDKKKSAALGPLGGAAPLSPRSSGRQNGHVKTTPSGPRPRTMIVAEEADTEYGHEDFISLGLRKSARPGDRFELEHLEMTLSLEERVQSKMREKFYSERHAEVNRGGDDVF